MRITMIGQKGLPAHSGGVERHVDDLVTRLTASGHDVTAYCRKSYTLNKNLVQTYFGAHLVYIPTVQSKHFDTIIYTVLATLHAIWQRADIIHYHGIGPALCAWIPRVLTPRTRVIVTYHCQDYLHGKWSAPAQSALRLGEWMACRFAHQLIVVSKTLKRYVKQHYGRNAIYIPNSVAMPKRSVPKKITRYGLERGNYVLLVSRLIPHKGIHYAIEAYLQLAKMMGKEAPKLVIVGEGAHTEAYVKQLKDMSRKSSNIMMLGAKSGEVLAELYSNARLFVQPSESEGLSIALLEAMSYGCPVLVSDIAENKEVLPSVGYTFKNRDAKDLAHRLLVILKSTHRTKTAAVLNRAHIEKYYEADTSFQKALRLYRQQARSS